MDSRLKPPVTFPFTLPPRYSAHERRDGGQGYVFVCDDEYLERKVAIKVMKVVSDAAVLRQEIAAVSDIRSRHVAEVYDVVHAKRSQMVGLVQEFVPGPSLEEYVKTSHDSKLLQVAWQLASGIADIHSHRKIHRDIKPSNARFDDEGVLKILDFGMAMVDREDAETHRARGTLGFIAPEPYGSPPVPVTKAVDTYAFGVLCWYMATRGSLAPAMLETPPGSHSVLPSFAESGASLPEDLIELLDGALSLKPGKRPSMRGIRDAIERHLLYGKHRAFIGRDNRVLERVGDSVVIKAGNDAIGISYDGLRFTISEIRGDVYVNNTPVTHGQDLPGSCVVTLGRRQMGYGREFVPIDMSHPGVVI